jgi:hypothetical protein
MPRRIDPHPLRYFVKFVLCLLLLASTVSVQAATHKSESARSSVVRLAPDFSFPIPGNRNQTLRGLHGQPVVLLGTDSPKVRAFRKQIDLLRKGYQEFASRNAVFVVAFKNGGGPVQSNIPFAIANNGPAVAAAYGVNDDFSLIIIGKDQNVDYQTPAPRPGERIRDVMQNSFVVQSESRKSIPKGE